MHFNNYDNYLLFIASFMMIETMIVMVTVSIVIKNMVVMLMLMMLK